ncbi:MAG: NAD-dependent epimerase/dehydratase family protein [Candidatus Binatia bacterium]
MRVLITGGMGVNGAVTARLLLSEGIRPVLLDNRMDLSLITGIERDVDLVEDDVLDPYGLEKVVTDYRITHIAHLAALMPEPAESDPRLGVKVGVDGTVNVLEVARSHRIRRVVYTSSKAVYGEITGRNAHPDYVPVDESHPRNPADLYGVIKVCCENVGRYYRERYGVEFVTLRFSSIYGPGKQARHGVLSLYGQIIEEVVSGREVTIPRGGDQINDVLYVGDVARAIFLALKAENLESWNFNIGTGRGVTLTDFGRVLGRMFPTARIEIGPGLDFRAGYKSSYCIFDIAKAKEQLGYTPQFDLEGGIREYIQTISRLRS